MCAGGGAQDRRCEVWAVGWWWELLLTKGIPLTQTLVAGPLCSQHPACACRRTGTQCLMVQTHGALEAFLVYFLLVLFLKIFLSPVAVLTPWPFFPPSHFVIIKYCVIDCVLFPLNMENAYGTFCSLHNRNFNGCHLYADHQIIYQYLMFFVVGLSHLHYF